MSGLSCFQDGTTTIWGGPLSSLLSAFLGCAFPSMRSVISFTAGTKFGPRNLNISIYTISDGSEQTLDNFVVVFGDYQTRATAGGALGFQRLAP